MQNKKILRGLINFFAKKKFINFFFEQLDIDTVFLNYHRVISDIDYQKKFRPNNDLVVSKSIFEQQIKYLKKNFNVISINDIHKNPNLKRKIVITFDDGYFDNMQNAIPILKKYKCPAIIYIVTGLLNQEIYPWWIRLWEIIESKNSIILNNSKIDLSKKDLKIKAYHFYSEKMKFMKLKDQKIFFSKINENLNYSNANKKKMFLSKKNLENISKEKIIEIGCHTHTHPNLKILNTNELTQEIIKSKYILQKILKKEINHFSIPYGTKNTYTLDTIKILKQFKFKTIVTTEHGNYDKKKLYEIPRIGIGNNDLSDTLYSKAVGFDSFINKIISR